MWEGVGSGWFRGKRPAFFFILPLPLLLLLLLLCLASEDKTTIKERKPSHNRDGRDST